MFCIAFLTGQTTSLPGGAVGGSQMADDLLDYDEAGLLPDESEDEEDEEIEEDPAFEAVDETVTQNEGHASPAEVQPVQQEPQNMRAQRTSPVHIQRIPVPPRRPAVSSYQEVLSGIAEVNQKNSFLLAINGPLKDILYLFDKSCWSPGFLKDSLNVFHKPLKKDLCRTLIVRKTKVRHELSSVQGGFCRKKGVGREKKSFEDSPQKRMKHGKPLLCWAQSWFPRFVVWFECCIGVASFRTRLRSVSTAVMFLAL